MGSSALKLRHDAREDLVASWPLEQALLVEETPEFAAYLETFVPSLAWKASAYAGRIWIEVERLYSDLDTDDDALLFGKWTVRRNVDLRRAIAAAFVAGAVDEPEPIDGRTRIRAVAIEYRPNERVGFVNLDLDGNGKTPTSAIIAALRADVGDDSFIVTSGSGRENRYRVLMRVKPSKHVAALLDLLARWAERHAIDPASYEVNPSTKHGRLPFGAGGCTRYSADLSERTRERPIDLLRAFLSLKTTDLHALADGQTTTTTTPKQRKAKSSDATPKQSLPREDASKQIAERLARVMSGQAPLEQENLSGQTTTPKQSLPRRYVEDRRSPTPRDVRELKKHGISGKGERNKALYAIVKDCLYRGLSEDAAIAQARNWIDDGKINASKDANTPSKREQQKRNVVNVVRRVYATHEMPGRPEPIALTPNEAARIKTLAERAAEGSGCTVNAIRSLLFGILPLFKAAKVAGLGCVRIHTWEWKQVAGSNYRELRAACNIFAATTEYRSAKSLMAQGMGKKAAMENAYARSWKTSFVFDL